MTFAIRVPTTAPLDPEKPPTQEFLYGLDVVPKHEVRVCEAVWSWWRLFCKLPASRHRDDLTDSFRKALVVAGWVTPRRDLEPRQP